MWRPTMCLLCLIASLAGAPLRQSEAADDLARSLGGPEPSHAVAPVDGGVGDEAEESILEAGVDVPSPSAIFLPAPAWLEIAPLDPGRPSAPGAGRPAVPPGSGRIGSARRFAWLQRFLF